MYRGDARRAVRKQKSKKRRRKIKRTFARRKIKFCDVRGPDLCGLAPIDFCARRGRPLRIVRETLRTRSLEITPRYTSRHESVRCSRIVAHTRYVSKLEICGVSRFATRTCCEERERWSVSTLLRKSQARISSQLSEIDA